MTSLADLDTDFCERSVVRVSFEATANLISWYDENDPDFSPALCLAWDLKRTFGHEGFDLFRGLNWTFEPPFTQQTLGSLLYPDCDQRQIVTREQYESALLEQWADLDRDVHGTDVLLIDAMAAARENGWKIPDDVFFTSELDAEVKNPTPVRAATDAVLDELAARSGARRAAERAEMEAVWKAESDAIYERWLSSGESDVLAALTRAKQPHQDFPMPANLSIVPSQPTGTPLISSMMTPRSDMEFLPSDSDEALAQQFVAKHSENLRFVAAWGRWLEWDGRRWKFDETLRAFDFARIVCRQVANTVDAKAAKGIASAKTVAAVERMAKADRLIAAQTDQWDLDPWLLNTPTGVIDLRTGEMRPALPQDYQTKLTAVAPGGKCPTWLTFLDRVTGGNRDLVNFLQVALGYGLTGVTREHAMFFLYGTGANGKSVLLSTVAGILGDYHTVAPIETFTASANERHPTDLAGLRGARVVTATETEEGRRWAESKIKVLTGGDKISARFMRQDFFEFTPQFKLVIAGNHKPGLRAVDEAIRRRIHLVPFTVTIPPEERDHQLADKLKAEWSGILTWLIEGCVRWQREGLQPPEVVRRDHGISG